MITPAEYEGMEEAQTERERMANLFILALSRSPNHLSGLVFNGLAIQKQVFTLMC